MPERLIRGDYSEGLWNDVQTYQDWKKFHRHDESIESRSVAYEILSGFLQSHAKHWPLDFVEVGFGSAIDFERCFKQWQKQDAIRYVGYEVMPQFARFARHRHRGCDFREGGFLDLEPLAYDIAYTRHTLQHVNPNLYEPCLRALLASARVACVVSWRMPPKGDGCIRCDERSWQCAPNEARTREMIKGAEFRLTVREFMSGDTPEQIYILEKRHPGKDWWKGGN